MSRRRGLSLLEVILALAILGGAIAVVGEIIRLGLRAAEDARDETDAQLLAESKLAEIAAGIEYPQPLTDAALDPEGNWLYTLEVEPSDAQSLIAVRIQVRPALAPVTATNKTFTLVRWMIDPGVASEADMAERDAETAEQERVDADKQAQQNSPTSGTPAAGGLGGGMNGMMGGMPPGLLPPNLRGGGGGFGPPGFGGNGPGGRGGPGGPGGGRGGPNGPGGGRGGPGGPGNGGPGGGRGGPNGPNGPGGGRGGPGGPGNAPIPGNGNQPPNMPTLPPGFPAMPNMGGGSRGS